MDLSDLKRKSRRQKFPRTLTSGVYQHPDSEKANYEYGFAVFSEVADDYVVNGHDIQQDHGKYQNQRYRYGNEYCQSSDSVKFLLSA